MPNWCANRLRVTGLSENVSQVRAHMRGEVRPAYARAEAEGIQLFLAGCAGLGCCVLLRTKRMRLSRR